MSDTRAIECKTKEKKAGRTGRSVGWGWRRGAGEKAEEKLEKQAGEACLNETCAVVLQFGVHVVVSLVATLKHLIVIQELD